MNIIGLLMLAGAGFAAVYFAVTLIKEIVERRKSKKGGKNTE